MDRMPAALQQPLTAADVPGRRPEDGRGDGLSCVYWRLAFTPGRRLLELAGDADEDVFASVGGG
jgi:hypothetical protein